MHSTVYSNKKLKYYAELLSGSARIEKKELEEIKKVIDRIGERAIRNKFHQLYNKHEESKANLVEQRLKENDEEKLKRIKEILANND